MKHIVNSFDKHTRRKKEREREMETISFYNQNKNKSESRFLQWKKQQQTNGRKVFDVRQQKN